MAQSIKYLLDKCEKQHPRLASVTLHTHTHRTNEIPKEDMKMTVNIYLSMCLGDRDAVGQTCHLRN